MLNVLLFVLSVFTWAPDWDRPWPGSSMNHVAAFVDHGEAHFFMIIRQGEVLHRYWRSGGWHDQLLTDGPPRFDRIAAGAGASHEWLVARDTSLNLWVRHTDAGVWSPWHDLHTLTGSRPAVAGNDVAYIFVVGTDGLLRVDLTGTLAGDDWRTIGSPDGRSVIGAPTLVGDRTEGFVVASDRTLWHFGWDHAGADEVFWTPVDVSRAYAGPVTAASTDSTTEIVAQDTNRALQHFTWDGSTYVDRGAVAPPARLAGQMPFIADLAATSSAPGVFDLYLVGTDGDLYHQGGH